MSTCIEKVTAFVIRQTHKGDELLLFEHPYAGIQIPAGTVEAGEMPEQTVLREVAEETGLTTATVREYLGVVESTLLPNKRIILPPAHVYARPDTTSFDWITVPKGLTVDVKQCVGDFTQITYIEWDRVPDPQYISMQITGWVLNDVLTGTRRRHFYRLDFDGETEARWTIFTDNHRFTLFWAPLRSLPTIIPPQDQWLTILFDPQQPQQK